MVEIPEFEKWKDVMHPGELWSAFGESMDYTSEPRESMSRISLTLLQ